MTDGTAESCPAAWKGPPHHPRVGGRGFPTKKSGRKGEITWLQCALMEPSLQITCQGPPQSANSLPLHGTETLTSKVSANFFKMCGKSHLEGAVGATNKQHLHFKKTTTKSMCFKTLFKYILIVGHGCTGRPTYQPVSGTCCLVCFPPTEIKTQEGKHSTGFPSRPMPNVKGQKSAMHSTGFVACVLSGT